MCFIFLLTISLFSKAKSDIELADVDALIAERRINEAFILVEKYMSENPLDFDNAQKRVSIIFESRNAYKLKADELLQIIVGEPLNDVKKLEIIAELEAMEANPNDEEKLFIQEVKTSSQFTYYRALFEQIMAEGAELLVQKQYIAATERFSDGFDLYYVEFFEQGFDPSLVLSVEKYFTNIKNSLIEYGQIQTELLGAFAIFNSALAVYDSKRALAAYPNLEQILREYAQIRNVSFLGGSYFKDVVLSLQEEFPDLNEAFFLPFAHRLLLGRESDDSPGIIAVIDAQWEDLYAESQKLLTTMIEKYSNTIAQDLSGATLNQLVSGSSVLQRRLTEITKVSTMGKEFLSLYTVLNDSSTTFMQNPHIEYENSLDYNLFIVLQAEMLLEYSTAFLAQQARYENAIVPKNPDVLLRSNNTEYVDFLVEHSDNNTMYLQTADVAFSVGQETRGKAPVNATVFTGLSNPHSVPWDNFAIATEQGFSLLSDNSRTEIVLSWESLSSFFAQGSTSIREEYELPYAEAIPLVNENMLVTVLSYPTEGLIILENIMQTITDDLALLQSQYDFLESAPQFPVIANPGSNLYASDKTTLLQNIAFLTDMENVAPEYIALASERVVLARQAENEGNLRFSQAEKSLIQENFDASRDFLQRSREKYNESLLYQESDLLRARSDSQLATLGTKITQLENELVIRDVRQLITDSRAQYYTSNFQQAESSIAQAEARWAVTNIEPNAEVVNLKALIGNALSVTTGRAILATDPLYPEMSQTLNIAYQHFDQGEKFLSQNNRTEGLEELSVARDKTRNVQVLYPFNQEASLLALQIDKLIDPVAFEKQFSQKYATAQTEYSQVGTSTRAYIDLLDLYEINPNYPGLEDFIYVVEIELGIIIPPPDLQAIARSTTLTREAITLYNSGARDEINLNNALALLNDALDSNPDNQDAMVLLDRINTNLGGQSLIVLSAGAEALYQEAVQELSRGNTITAASIVTQLWQNPEMQQSSKIVDLKQRVDSLL